jgi:hypothetical protein
VTSCGYSDALETQAVTHATRTRAIAPYGPNAAPQRLSAQWRALRSLKRPVTPHEFKRYAAAGLRTTYFLIRASNSQSAALITDTKEDAPDRRRKAHT